MRGNLIIQSRRKWYTYPLFFFALFNIYWVVTDFNSLTETRGGVKVLSFALSIILFAAYKFWFIRRIKVYNDRVEVIFPLHWKWNYQVMLKDVDCCCAEIVEVENKSHYIRYNRIYFLTGKKLWLYISEGDSSNFEEMLDVLTDYFGIPIRSGSIDLSSSDLKIVEHGGYIELEDISDEELSTMRMQRRQRSLPRHDFVVPRSTRWKYFILEYALFILPIAAAMMYLFYGQIIQIFQNKNTVALSCIDAKTKIPSVTYYDVDSVDVDNAASVFYSSKAIYRSDGKKLDTHKNVSYYAFPVKGRSDVWIFVVAEDYVEVPSPDYYGIDYFARKLNRKHTYENVADEKDYQNLIATISEKTNTKIPKAPLLLVVYDETPMYTGRATYFKALERIKNKKFKEAYLLMKQAAEEIAAAQYQLGVMYEYGNGTAANADEALRLYILATKQDYDEKTKVDALNQLSYLYAERQQYEKAIAVIDSAIAIKPQEANLYDSKGEHLYKSGDKEGAKRMWQRVMELNPQFTDEHQSELSRLLSGK